MKKYLLFIALFILNQATYANYPAVWWQAVDESQRQSSWEVLPQEAKSGEVILSKRNELGVFSNLAHTPFIFEGVHYASIEALWQMMKYPDKTDVNDLRNDISEYPYTREEVYALHGFASKKAGSKANKINKANQINWISYKHLKFNYKDMQEGSVYHYKLIKKAISEKLKQNPLVYKLLLKTKGLVLKPDHKQSSNSPKSYFYHKILMEFRDQ